MPKTLYEACVPRESVFDPSVRDTVYSIDDLNLIDSHRFFDENYVTQGMRQLLTESFKRLEGKSQNAAGTYLLSQAMGGGKTHNLIALGLLAKHPEIRSSVMSDFYQPGPMGAARVVTFNGRNTDTDLGIWGEIADQLNQREVFRNFYSPLRPPGQENWVELLRGQPTLILLDELPPYFEAAQGVTIGQTTLASLTTTAIANLLVAVVSEKLPNVCVVLTDLRTSAYSSGSGAVNSALQNLEQEANRSVSRIDPVRLNTDELYHIMRTRLFKTLPEEPDVTSVADAYRDAIDEAQRLDMTTVSAPEVRTEITRSYPFHPAIRDLFARFRENPGFQQTRALIRIMRNVVADLWESDAGKNQYLVAAHALDLHQPDILSEIQMINSSLDNAIAHDIAEESRTSVAESIDEDGPRNAQDAATLIFLSSLSRAVNPTLGLDRSTIVAYLASPGRDLTRLRSALTSLQTQAWYLHATSGGALLFRNVENLNAKLENYATSMLRDERENELRDRLRTMFEPQLNHCYQIVEALPALDQVEISQDRTTLIIFRPSTTGQGEIEQFFAQQRFKNRVLFLTGGPQGYAQVLERSAYLRAIELIIREFQQDNRRDDDPQVVDARQMRDRISGNFYMACRESFQILYYPSQRGLTKLEIDPRYVGNRYEGETQIVNALKEVYKFRDETGADSDFRTMVENRLWPSESKEVAWSTIKQAAASRPDWVWHHPRTLEDLRDELVRRDLWRELGGGYYERGPFPKPATSVQVRTVSRDPNTGSARLEVRPQHADTVHVNYDGPATTSSEVLQDFNFETTAPRLSFLAVDSTGEHETGDPTEWKNQIDVKYQFFTRDGQQYCQLQAIGEGTIRYTVDGSSPDNAGSEYSEPFPVPPGSRVVLARAILDQDLKSDVIQAQVPEPGEEFSINRQRPARLRRQFRRDSSSESYEFLKLAEDRNARIGGVAVGVAFEQRWIDLRVDDKTLLTPAEIRSYIEKMHDVVTNGQVSLETPLVEFQTGQDLIDFAEDLRTDLRPDEVEQS